MDEIKARPPHELILELAAIIVARGGPSTGQTACKPRSVTDLVQRTLRLQ